MPNLLATFLHASLVCFTGTETDGGTEETDTGTETGAEPICGDGIVDAIEWCDDGNRDGLDGCNAHCSEPGIVLWDTIVLGDFGPSGPGIASADVDGSIHFSNELGLLDIDHDSGDPLLTNPNLELRRLHHQAPGRMVAYDAHVDVVVGLDEAGEGVWSLPIDGLLRALAVDGMGNAIVLEDDMTLSSLDSNGAINWQTTVNYAVNPLLAADRSGIYISSGDFHEHWLYGLDVDGREQWDSVEANYEALFNAMAVENGRIALVGTEWFSGDDNYLDFCVRVYDTKDGDLEWSDRIDGPFDLDRREEDQGQQVVFDARGNLVVAGTVGRDAPSTNSMWLGRYASDGRLLWTYTLDDGLAHSVMSLTPLSDGDLLVSDGWTASSMAGPEARLLLFTPRP